MTLDTRVAIGEPIDQMAVYQFLRALLNTPEGVEPREEIGESYRPGQRQIDNPPGIGLDAWLMTYGTTDGQPFPVHEHDDYCSVTLGGDYETTQEDIDTHAESVAADPTDNGSAYIEVSLDTAYSWRGPNGESCSTLHAALVWALGTWLEEQGVTAWWWYNEYAGTWHERFDKLKEFGGAHSSTGAEQWFETLVRPAIETLAGPDAVLEGVSRIPKELP